MKVFGKVLDLLVEIIEREQHQNTSSSLGFWKSSTSKSVDLSPLVLQCKRLSLEVLLKDDASWLLSLLKSSFLISRDDLFKLKCTWTASEYAVLLESVQLTDEDGSLERNLFGSLASDVNLLSDASVDASVLASQLLHIL